MWLCVLKDREKLGLIWVTAEVLSAICACKTELTRVKERACVARQRERRERREREREERERETRGEKREREKKEREKKRRAKEGLREGRNGKELLRRK